MKISARLIVSWRWRARKARKAVELPILHALGLGYGVCELPRQRIYGEREQSNQGRGDVGERGLGLWIWRTGSVFRSCPWQWSHRANGHFVLQYLLFKVRLVHPTWDGGFVLLLAKSIIDRVFTSTLCSRIPLSYLLHLDHLSCRVLDQGCLFPARIDTLIPTLLSTKAPLPRNRPFIFWWNFLARSRSWLYPFLPFLSSSSLHNARFWL